MELQVGVKILLKNKKGKYLLVRRSSIKYPDAGNQWDLVGGRINPGVSLFENLQREVKEETGLSITENPKLLGAQDILVVEGKHIVRLSYLGETDGEPILDEENTDFGWFTFKEIKEISQNEINRYFKEFLATLTEDILTKN